MFLSKAEYEDYKKYLSDKDNGRILTPDGLRIICSACNNDPKEIGEHILRTLARINSKEKR